MNTVNEKGKALYVRITQQIRIYQQNVEGFKRDIKRYFYDRWFQSRTFILLDTETKRIEESHKKKNYVILLSPAFYWSKHITLPTIKEAVAEKMAPGIFDTLLPMGEYRYSAQRCEDGSFNIFAYQADIITNKLDEIGIPLSKIDCVMFLQSFAGGLEKGIALNSENVVQCVEGIVCRFSRTLAGPTQSFDTFLRSSPLNKRYLREIIEDDKVDDKSIIIGYALISAIFASLITYFVLLQQELRTLNDITLKTASTYGVVPNSGTVKSLVNTWTKKEGFQLKFRDKLKTMISIPLEDNKGKPVIEAKKDDENAILEKLKGFLGDNKERIKEIEFKDKQMTATVRISSERRAEALKDYLKTAMKLESMSVKTIEGGLYVVIKASVE